MEISLLCDDKLVVENDCILMGAELTTYLGVLQDQRIQFSTPTGEVLLRVGLDPNLRGNETLVSKSTLELLHSSKSKCQVPEVTLGCDPEFFIIWNGYRINAAAYLPFEGQIGCDGGLGELRPMYGLHENIVVENLRGLIQGIPKRLKREDFAIGAGYPPDGRNFSYEGHSFHSGIAAGFHVHLGIPPELLNTKADFHRPALNHLVQALDWYVSVPMVPLETSNERRLGQSSYGHPGDFRTTNVTLEYRTPGGFYLRTPILARGLLGLSLLVTEHFVSAVKKASDNFTNLRKFSAGDFRSLLPIPEPKVIQATLMSSGKSMAYKALPGVREYLKSLPNYPKHRETSEEFFRVVDNSSIPSANLIHNWEISS